MIENIFQLILSILLSGLIGYEREKIHRAAGFRTHILVGLSSTLVTLVSLTFTAPNTDPTRIAAAIITGIGFIGAGTIMQLKGHILGITTAASLFFVAIIGIVIGFSSYFLAILTTLLAYLILIEGRKFKKLLKLK